MQQLNYVGGAIKSKQTLPVSNAPINGILRIQRKANLMSSWEFCVTRKAELNKLLGYPLTRGVLKDGIDVTLRNGGKHCKGAFHGYYNHFYIGSAVGLFGLGQTESYRAFLKNFGVNVGSSKSPIPVTLEFDHNNVVYVS